MKPFLTGALLLLILCTACNQAQKQAQQCLAQATALYEQKQYAAAKQMIDSIRVVAPKAFDEIRAGMQLMRRVELEETRRSVAYADSLLALREEAIVALKKPFLLEKDTAYQTLGLYVHKLQKLERNVERCYLRAKVDEKGSLQLNSVYYGKVPLEHTTLKLELPDGTFVESTPIAYDGGNNYRFKHNGFYNEVVTFKGDLQQPLTGFIAANADKRIKVTCHGGKRPYIFYLDKQAKQAISAAVTLSAALTEIETLRLELRKGTMRIAQLEKRIAEKEPVAKPQ